MRGYQIDEHCKISIVLNNKKKVEELFLYELHAKNNLHIKHRSSFLLDTKFLHFFYKVFNLKHPNIFAEIWLARLFE